MKEKITEHHHLLLKVEDESNDVGPTVPTMEASSSHSITPLLLLSAFVAVLGSFSFGIVMGYSSPVQAEIMKELDLSTAEYSLFGSMINIGGLFGAILCGKITDYLGRRNALRLIDLFYIFGWIFISASQAVWLLDLGRWMLGFAVAVTGYAVPVYVAEFTPKNVRGGFMGLHVLMLTVGASAVFLIGLVVYWRSLALIGLIPSVIQLAGTFFIPESPRWLMMANKNNKEFEATLQRLRGGSVDISQEAADLRDCVEALHEMERVSILQLFQKKFAYALTVGIGLSTLTSLVGLTGIVLYANSIFASVGISVTVGTVVLALFQIPSVGLGMLLMDKCGRRPLLMISAAGLCFGCLLTGFAFLFEEHHLLDGFCPYIGLIGVLVYFASYPLGMGGAHSLVVSEIFPLNIKGSAGSLLAIISEVVGWIVAYAFNFSMGWSSSGTFFVLAINSALALLFVAKLMPETKGKTLEEVHLSISKIWQ